MSSPLKMRLIEPAPPSVNILSYGFYPRLGLPLIGAALKAAGHDVRLRFGRLLEHLWGWLYIRLWQRHPANRASMRKLSEFSGRPSAAGE